MRNSILIYHIGSIGDTVATYPVLRAARRHFGDGVKITLLHDRQAASVVSARSVLEGTGLIEDSIDYDASVRGWSRLRSSLALWAKLLIGGYQAAVYAVQSVRSPQQVRRDRLFFRLCGIRQLLGFHALDERQLHPRDGNGRPLRVQQEAIRRLSRLRLDGMNTHPEDAAPPFLAVPEQERDAVDAWLRQNRTRPELPLVALCPFSKQQACEWPTARLVEIGRRLLRSYPLELVLVGGAKDRTECESMISQWDAGINAAGRFSVMGSAALLARCAFAITLDSGPMHLAAAVGTPCVALFSGHDFPGQWEPLGDGHLVVRNKVDCEGCGLQSCPFPDHPCMRGIGADAVWDAVTRMCDSIRVPRSCGAAAAGRAGR